MAYYTSGYTIDIAHLLLYYIQFFHKQLNFISCLPYVAYYNKISLNLLSIFGLKTDKQISRCKFLLNEVRLYVVRILLIIYDLLNFYKDVTVSLYPQLINNLCRLMPQRKLISYIIIFSFTYNDIIQFSHNPYFPLPSALARRILEDVN